MLEVIVLGIMSGFATALTAIGVVLIYRAARFANFAQAQLGIVPMLLLGKLVLEADMSWYLAFPLMVAAGGLLGAVADFITRPLAERSRMTLLVASIGISQFLIGFTYFDWLGADRALRARVGYPEPFKTTIEIGSLTLHTSDILTLILVPAICLVLYVFFKRTMLGKTIRAAASNGEAALLAGLPIRRLRTITWVIAGAISTVAAVLAAPAFPNYTAAALGPELILPALGAAALGGMTSFPIAFGGAVTLGVLQRVVGHLTGSSTDGTLAVVVGILVFLAIRGVLSRNIVVTDSGRIDGDVADRVIVPEVLRDRFAVRHVSGLVKVVFFAIAAALPFMPLFENANQTFRLTQTLIIGMTVAAVSLLAGLVGQVSLGQFAFVGAGALIAGRFTMQGWALPLEIAVCGLVGVVIGIVLGLPTLKNRALAVTISTLGLAVLAPNWLFYEGWFSGPASSGTPISIGPAYVPGYGLLDSAREVYLTVLVVLTVLFLVAARLRRSVAGYAMIAVRDNEAATVTLGLRPAALKLKAFAFAGFIAATAGVLDVAAYSSTDAARYTPDLSFLVVTMAVIGGLGSLAGALGSAVLIFGLPLFMYDVVNEFIPGSAQFQLMFGGAILLVNLIHLPAGLAQEWRRMWTKKLRKMAIKASGEAPVAAAPAPGSTGEAAAIKRSGIIVRAAEQGERTIEHEAVPALDVTGLSVEFGVLRALNGVDLHVQPGEIVGLIGNNGAGKSTIVNAVSGIIPTAGGRVELFGTDVTSLPPHARAIHGMGRTFQDAKLFGGLSVEEILILAASARKGVPLVPSILALPPATKAYADARRQADEIMDWFGVAAYRDTPASDLSTGIRRVVDLCIQVATRPKLLLLDEPAAGLGQREVESFGPMLRETARELDAAVLIIEHDMPLMLGLADRLYCLELGEVIAEGSPLEIRQNPRVIASYLGTDDSVAAARSGSLPRVGELTGASD